MIAWILKRKRKLQPPHQQLQPRLCVQIFGRLQNAKRKRRPVNAILHALQMIVSRPKRNVKKNARFARQHMNFFIMLSFISTSRNKMGIDITFLLSVQVYLWDSVVHI